MIVEINRRIRQANRCRDFMMMREIKSWEANLHSLQTSGVLHMKNGRGLWNLVITLDNHKREYKTASVNSLILPLAPTQTVRLLHHNVNRKDGHHLTTLLEASSTAAVLGS